jgi:uncharacterized protein (TIGR03000 family)
MLKRWTLGSGFLALVLALVLCTPQVVQAQRYRGGGVGRWGGGWGGGYYGGWGRGWDGGWGRWGGVGIGLGYWPGYYGYGSYGSYSPSYGYYSYSPSYWGGYYPSYSYVPSYYDSGSAGMTYAPEGGSYSYGYNQPMATDPNRASIDVRVPRADAEVMFEGSKTSQTGTDRAFVSPPLQPGQNYTYVVQARWTDNGKEVNQTRRVPVRAGERVTVDFTQPEK